MTARPDIQTVKAQTDIVEVVGRYVALSDQGSALKGLCPFHEEKTPSFTVYRKSQWFECFGCGEKGDVFDFLVKKLGISTGEAVKMCADGVTPDAPATAKTKAKSAARPAPTVVPLTEEDARTRYTKAKIEDCAQFILEKNPQRVVKGWRYRNAKGMVELLAVRFENDAGSKNVMSFYWNGRTLAMKNYPNLLYNRDALAANPNAPVLIVFGEKCADAVDSLANADSDTISDQNPGFIGITWNGGEKKVTKPIDWTPLEGRNLYLWPDDDPPGRDCTAELLKRFPAVKIVAPIPEISDKVTAAAREKYVAGKPDATEDEIAKKEGGADIADALEILSPETVLRHIQFSARPATPPEPEPLPLDDSEYPIEAATGQNWPFTILGVADDGRAYFISETERMYAYNLSSLTKTHLLNLRGVEWWTERYPGGAKGWERAISEIIYLSNLADFDPDRMRGRGAWSEPDGAICYHNGKQTIGDRDPDRVYLRRAVKHIGIKNQPATATERHQILVAASDLTFATTADYVRTLGWSVLAPFAGALPWRPAGLLTAASGTGKTTIINSIVQPLAQPIVCSGGESTAAGIRQRIGVDSCAVVVEEAEADTQKKRQNRDDTFSLMRQSTSDNSPDVLKGTVDGKGISFRLRSMFFFVSVSPEIDAEADENRIFRVGLRKPDYGHADWLKREAFLKRVITPAICRGVRAYTWQHLREIIDLSARFSGAAQKVSGVDNRSAFAEAMLMAAFNAVFLNRLEPDDQTIADFVAEFYGSAPSEPRRNETEEMLDRLLLHIVRVDGGESFALGDMLDTIKTETEFSTVHEEGIEAKVATKFRRIVGMHGLGLTPDFDLAIAKNHPEIMKILDSGKGYHHRLVRHPRMIDKGRNVGLGSKIVRNCVIIGRDADE